MSLVKNTQEIECLVQSLQEVIQTRTEHDKAMEEYEYNSWGYHGRDLVDAMESAADDFGKRLTALIDARVDAKLVELGIKKTGS